MTYRLGDHTTADDAARYRSPEEVQVRWKEEPIARLRAYLVSQKAWGKQEEEDFSRMPGSGRDRRRAVLSSCATGAGDNFRPSLRRTAESLPQAATRAGSV